MPEPRKDLRSTQESIQRDADRLKQLEATKAALDPGDPRVDRLSEQVERLTAEIHGKGAAERELTDEVTEQEGRRAHE